MQVDATKRGGLARFINHSCEVSVQGKIIQCDACKMLSSCFIFFVLAKLLHKGDHC
jgi:hypothetical protein